MDKLTTVILCGGSGTRLWPLSRELMPKQFIKFFDETSLFQKTLQRNAPFSKEIILISNKEHFYILNDQIKNNQSAEKVGNNPFNAAYILEAVPKNTAAALAFACLAVDEETVLLVTPSDHLIKNTDVYFEAVKQAKDIAEQGCLVTFGVKPTRPETGYGYIDAGEDLHVRAFYEKPSLENAEIFLKNPHIYWNAGIFCFKAKTMLEELKNYAPQVYETALAAFNARTEKEGNVSYLPLEETMQIPEISIDYAVFEKSKKVKCIPAEFAWSDLGSFAVLHKEYAAKSDAEENVVSCANHININSRGNFIYLSPEQNKMIATIDVDDLIIADTGDALLVAPLKSSQKVKDVVAKVKQTSSLHREHKVVHRPWGTYTVLENSNGYKIKKIIVAPGEHLSLQKHFHRSEHWIVLSGTATVQIEDEIKLVRPNESIYIKMGERHRLSNEGRIPVVIIEAQVGEYTEEDDIVRFDDDYIR